MGMLPLLNQPAAVPLIKDGAHHAGQLQTLEAASRYERATRWPPKAGPHQITFISLGKLTDSASRCKAIRHSCNGGGGAGQIFNSKSGSRPYDICVDSYKNVVFNKTVYNGSP